MQAHVCCGHLQLLHQHALSTSLPAPMQNHTLAPGDSKVIRANIKVSSTETGVIFGNIVYEGTGYAERSVVVLNDIHIDIMDYISPAHCADVQVCNALPYACIRCRSGMRVWLSIWYEISTARLSCSC